LENAGTGTYITCLACFNGNTEMSDINSCSKYPHSGCWICGCRSAPGQSDNVSGRSDRSNDEGLPVASARAAWLCFDRFLD
jgi:hypothetical protein